MPDPTAVNPDEFNLELITPDALCTYGPRPYLMTGALVQAIRQHFSDRFNVEEAPLRDAVWSPDPATAIVIESSTVWKPELSGTRPAVVVRRDDYTASSRGINDQIGSADIQGNTHFCAFYQGSHTIFCIASEAGEAERLGSEVARELRHSGPALRWYLKLHKFKLAQHGRLVTLAEAAGSYVVPLTVAYAFEDTWTLEPHAPRLRKVALTALIKDAYGF